MKKAIVLILVLFTSGCAVGNKYNYRDSAIDLPVKAVDEQTLVLTVNDLRPYVLNGDKDSSFVGLQRGGFGNPFSVTTASGQPMTADMSAAIKQALADAGYRVFAVEDKTDMPELKNIAAAKSADRIVVLDVYDWKSDIYASVTLHCDLQLNVFDASGTLLANNTMRFEEEVAGAQLTGSKNSEILADEFATRIGYLFNKEEIRKALR